MRAVFDANVIVAGICWQGEGWLCFKKMARRQVFPFGSIETVEETRETALRIIRKQNPPHNAAGRLTWYLEKVRIVDPAPLGKQRSRDAKDDPYLAAALASKAGYVVTYDKDLLDLGKPFGIKIIRPVALLRMF
ncbi:MAG: putative toxin-antitoxin system toxin component, PIN family [Verrucomicrobia bacterium]|nr:putative toxin-antitoxin system toxin component, PIN family [Verrucomicrobiota bacterium]